MVSIKAAARASIVVSMMIAAVLAEPGERVLREDPLGDLDNQDLADLLDMDLDEIFLMPKTMLQDGGGLPNNYINKKHHRPHNNNNIKRHHQSRHLQEDQQEGGSPSPLLAETAAPTAAGAIDRGIFFTPSPSLSSLAETTGAPTDATDRGFSSSSFSSFSSPSAAPTSAPTMGSGSRGGVFGTGSPTVAPSSLGRDFDIEEDIIGDVTPPREVAAAQRLSSGGSAGVAIGVVAITFLVVVAGGVLS